MASVLKSAFIPGVGSGAPTVCLTAGAATTITIIGLMMANVSANPIKGTAQVKRGATVANIIAGGPIPNANTMCPVGENGKIVLMPNDILQCITDTGTMDVVVSYLEQT
jgi:hypothetical protein